MKMIKAASFLLFSLLIPYLATAHSSDFFPRNQVHANIEKVYLQTDRDFYFLGDTIWLKAYLLDGKSLSLVSDIQNLYIELFDSEGKIIQSQVILCEYGQASGSIMISDASVTGPFLLRAYTDYQKNFGEEMFFHKTIRISKAKNSFEIESENATIDKEEPEIDISFFPEGGFLLTGTQNLIAFKAVDQTGKGIPIEGKVINSNGEAVVFFRTDYKGMGRLFFDPEKGESYEVLIDGRPDFRYSFSDIRSEAMKLVMLEQNQQEVTLKILSNFRKRSKDLFYVVCYSRDSLLFKKEIEHTGTMKLKVETDAILAGINRFILLNETLEPVSERLVFRDILNVNNLEIKTSQMGFATRSLVNLEILDDIGTLDSGYSSLSLAVVNENSLVAGGKYQDIASYLFLDSELKGYIESPADYFVDEEHISSKDKLNLLMLTNGWCNYLKELSELDPSDFEYQKTAGITIKGSAERLVGKKPIVGGAITLGLFTEDGNYFLEDVTDSTGWFSIDSLFFYDTATIFSQALNEKGKQRTEVFLDTEAEREPTISPSIINSMQNITDIPLEQYRHKYFSDIEYREYHPEDGSILLEEVEITGRKIEKDDGHFRIYLRADDVLEVTSTDYYHANVLQFLQGRVAGLKINGSNVSLRGTTSLLGGSSPLFILDGMPIFDEPLDIIMSIPMTNIDKVEVLKGNSAVIYGSHGNNGVIAIYTKNGEVPEELDFESIGAITRKVAGFSSAREFYSPKYTPDNIDNPRPDHRTTLFWDPEIMTKNGRAEVPFYTADDLGYFRIIVEGITNKGQICYGTTGFMVDSYHKETLD